MPLLCNSVFLDSHFARECVATMGPRFPLLHSNDPDHAGYLCPRKNVSDRQTDMEGPVRFSSFTLQREEHLIMERSCLSSTLMLILKTKSDRNPSISFGDVTGR
jgi:hypothetical protein